MEVPFDPEAQCKNQFEVENKEKEKHKVRVANLTICPHCLRDSSWKLVSGGLRCRKCGAYVGMTDQNRRAMMQIGMLKQVDESRPMRGSDLDD